MLDEVQVISTELKLRPEQVAGAVALLKEGAPVPFIARYRMERTGALDEEALSAVKERLGMLTALEARRTVILSSLKAQAKLDPALQAQVEAAASRTELEDLYFPFCPRPKTPGAIAREKGLEPLAELIVKQETVTGDVEQIGMAFLSAEKGVKELVEAFAGAREILAERWADDAGLRGEVRQLVAEEGRLVTQAAPGVDLVHTKFAGYAQFAESLAKLPSHRVLAVLRGEAEKRLVVTLEAPRPKIVASLTARLVTKPESIFAAELAKAIEECVDRRLLAPLLSEVRRELKAHADRAAADLFARNLRALLLHPALGEKKVLALAFDPRHGTRAAVLAPDGKALAHAPLPVEATEEARKTARETLTKLVKEHAPEAVAIGNGREGRDFDALLRELLAAENMPQVPRVLVNEAGAAAYSASRLAREELPDLDLPTRAAVSIGRRLQNPLAELVKLSPKSIGVGQYQHDVEPKYLVKKLDEVVESCVNLVGADLNTAGAPLLKHVSGLGQSLSHSIAETRTRKGPFASREGLREVPGFGPKAYELSAGFLRIHGGANPLDGTAIHPERYPLVEKMALALNVPVKDLVGNADLVAKIDLKAFESPEACAETLRDIAEELRHPGRDPRGPFVPPVFNDEIKDLRDLQAGQTLNGVVTNLTAFGAFVDLGVHQDGLVHVSEISHRFVKDPAQVLHVGQAVKVKVLTVDLEKHRVSLSMKALEAPPAAAARPPRPPRPPRAPRPAAPAGVSTAPAPAGTEGAPSPVPSGTDSSAPAAAPAASGERGAPPPQGERGRFRREFPRRDQRAGPAAPGAAPAEATPPPPEPGRGERREGDRRAAERRGPRRGPREGTAPPPPPGKPDYAKFFVQKKRRERKEFGPRREGEASRDEVRQIMRQQEHSGTTLGNLLKQAGIIDPTEEPKPVPKPPKKEAPAQRAAPAEAAQEKKEAPVPVAPAAAVAPEAPAPAPSGPPPEPSSQASDQVAPPAAAPETLAAPAAGPEGSAEPAAVPVATPEAAADQPAATPQAAEDKPPATGA